MKLVLAEVVIYDYSHRKFATQSTNTIPAGVYQLFVSIDRVCMSFRPANNGDVNIREVAEEGDDGSVIDTVLYKAAGVFGQHIVSLIRANLDNKMKNKGVTQETNARFNKVFQSYQSSFFPKDPDKVATRGFDR